MYIGIHGYNFMTASYKVFSLFSHYGLTVAGNDAMVSVVLSLANIAMGMTAAAFGVLLILWGPESWSEGIPNAHVLAGLCCFLLGHSISSMYMAGIKAANKTIFICWIENPHALEATHTKAHDLLHSKSEAIGIKEPEHDLNEVPGHVHIACCTHNEKPGHGTKGKRVSANAKAKVPTAEA